MKDYYHGTPGEVTIMGVEFVRRLRCKRAKLGSASCC
jgi:hypothetical protein